MIELNQLLVESISDLKMFIYNKEFQLSINNPWQNFGSFGEGGGGIKGS